MRASSPLLPSRSAFRAASRDWRGVRLADDTAAHRRAAERGVLVAYRSKNGYDSAARATAQSIKPAIITWRHPIVRGWRHLCAHFCGIAGIPTHRRPDWPILKVFVVD